MNAKLAVLILMLTSGWLSGCTPRTEEVSPDEAAIAESRATDPVDGAARGNPNYRTWTVFLTGESDDPHMRVGDSFRLQQAGGGYQLKPLTRMKGRWGYPEDSGYVVELEKITAALLCGEVAFVGHHLQTHRIKVEVKGDDLLFVEFLLPEKPCTSQDTHGGTAHAQN